MLANKQKSLFLFHDYETFGQHPALDRPAQFAGIRTDANFTIIEEPQIFYCAPADDYLPQPQAVMITGITPQYAITHGINEAEFAKRIHASFSVANSCILGYNNIRFDDEVTRHIFYRNFYDPYAYSWQQGNSRWDLLDVLRACYALRPDGINWPINDEGLPSFKLEHLTTANGIEHANAHDAMADVFATIEMAKLIKQAQPRMFDYFFQLRNKNKITQLIDIIEMTPLVHVSGIFGAIRANTSLIAPLAWHPQNRNAIIACDLAADISPLLTLDRDTLRQRLYTPKAELAIPIKLIHINKCPILAPATTLSQTDAHRIALDLDYCLNNLAVLRQHNEVRDKVIQLFSEQQAFPELSDVDAKLYSAFFSDHDRSTMAIIRQTLPQNLPALYLKFDDPRMKQLLFRYRARNYPTTLTEQEQLAWLHHRREMLTTEKITQYLQTIEQLFVVYQGDKEKCQQLKALVDYANQIAS
ncbi:MAG: exodeoxyribonuclease I [Arsenophonus endosymbiont of Dermacentor nuttalli]